MQLESCGVKRPPAPHPQPSALPLPPADAIFVADYSRGSDESGTGTLASPFRTVHKAVNVSRAVPRGKSKAVVLRGGVHFLPSTVELGPADSGLTIQRYPFRTFHRPSNIRKFGEAFDGQVRL